MKITYDLSALDRIFAGCADGEEMENRLKEAVLSNLEKFDSVACKERFISVPLSGNKADPYTYAGLDAEINFNVTRVYSKRTWKPIEYIWKICGYNVRFFHRNNVYESYKTDFYRKKISAKVRFTTDIDTDGNLC